MLFRAQQIEDDTFNDQISSNPRLVKAINYLTTVVKCLGLKARKNLNNLSTPPAYGGPSSRPSSRLTR